jgi:hypothetical protein
MSTINQNSKYQLEIINKARELKFLNLIHTKIKFEN